MRQKINGAVNNFATSSEKIMSSFYKMILLIGIWIFNDYI